MKLIVDVFYHRALGLGATRGRLYIKHQDVFKVLGVYHRMKFSHTYLYIYIFISHILVSVAEQSFINLFTTQCIVKKDKTYGIVFLFPGADHNM